MMDDSRSDLAADVFCQCTMFAFENDDLLKRVRVTGTEERPVFADDDSRDTSSYTPVGPVVADPDRALVVKVFNATTVSKTYESGSVRTFISIDAQSKPRVIEDSVHDPRAAVLRSWYLVSGHEYFQRPNTLIHDLAAGKDVYSRYTPKQPSVSAQYNNSLEQAAAAMCAPLNLF
jgi:hypothetical protein